MATISVLDMCCVPEDSRRRHRRLSSRQSQRFLRLCTVAVYASSFMDLSGDGFVRWRRTQLTDGRDANVVGYGRFQ